MSRKGEAVIVRALGGEEKKGEEEGGAGRRKKRRTRVWLVRACPVRCSVR